VLRVFFGLSLRRGDWKPDGLLQALTHGVEDREESSIAKGLPWASRLMPGLIQRMP
jgi:hypothetical protein